MPCTSCSHSRVLSEPTSRFTRLSASALLHCLKNRAVFSNMHFWGSKHPPWTMFFLIEVISYHNNFSPMIVQWYIDQRHCFICCIFILDRLWYKSNVLLLLLSISGFFASDSTFHDIFSCSGGRARDYSNRGSHTNRSVSVTRLPKPAFCRNHQP